MLMPTGSDQNFNMENIDAPKGRQREIACYSWTTASGAITPIMFKIMDENDVIQTIKITQVNYSEKKIYCGIPSFEFNCDVIINGIRVNLILQYFTETCKWFLLEKFADLLSANRLPRNVIP